MRVIAGQFRGRRLRLPKTRLRPTADRVKEALFSILGARVAGANVVDLFAGSGSLGIEALSRGAEFVTFVELSGRAAGVIEANVELVGARESSEIVKQDAIKFLETTEPGSFDIALADPPYNEGFGAKVRDLFMERGFATMLCVEHAVGELDGAADTRRYGDSVISFFKSP